MKQSLVDVGDGPDELSEFIMTEEEMSWAKNTMTPDQIAEMLSGELDLDHFLVMMVTVHTAFFFRCATELFIEHV